MERFDPLIQHSMPAMRSLPRYQRTRLAPTPSGYLHMGNLFSFAMTAGLARMHGAAILLRIDDLDQGRVRREYLDDLFDTLRFAGIPWDEGPTDTDDFLHLWSQRRRMPHYRAALAHLKEKEAVFACACTRSQLARVAPDGSYPGTCLSGAHSLNDSMMNWRMLTASNNRIRLKKPDGDSVYFDIPPDTRHVVVRKKGGDPAYQLASVVDDIHFGVDLIVRGEDLMPSTLMQIQLSQLLPENRFSDAVFLHHPLLCGPGGLKLSKSAGATSVRHLRATGHSSAAVWERVAAWSGYPPARDWQGLFQGYLQHP